MFFFFFVGRVDVSYRRSVVLPASRNKHHRLNAHKIRKRLNLERIVDDNDDDDNDKDDEQPTTSIYARE